MTVSPALRAFRDLRRIIRSTVDQAKLGYEFSPNSYSFGALSACLVAEKAVEVLRDHMSDHFEVSNPDQS
jgi:hypothetical protein